MDIDQNAAFESTQGKLGASVETMHLQAALVEKL